jgi:hypothetical protein
MPDQLIHPNWAIAIPLVILGFIGGLILGRILSGSDPIDRKNRKRD